MKLAEFTFDGTIWWPWNDHAVAATALVSTRFIRDAKEFLPMRSHGYMPVDRVTGKELGRLDITV